MKCLSLVTPNTNIQLKSHQWCLYFWWSYHKLMKRDVLYYNLVTRRVSGSWNLESIVFIHNSYTYRISVLHLIVLYSYLQKKKTAWQIWDDSTIYSSVFFYNKFLKSQNWRDSVQIRYMKSYKKSSITINSRENMVKSRLQLCKMANTDLERLKKTSQNNLSSKREVVLDFW